MDDCLPDWKSDFGAEFPAPLQRKPPGFENELVELLWQNGETEMQSQNTRKQKQVDETASWMDCPIDESFEREFCANFLSEIPSFDESDKKLDSKRGPNFAASEVNHVVSSSQHQDFAPPPPPRFRAADTAVKKQACSRVEHKCSGMTVGSSHCASNQVVNEVGMSWASSSGMGRRTVSAVAREEAYARKMNEQAVKSCSGGSGSSTLWKTSSQSNYTSRHKRKSQNMEESKCPSDATESESAAGTKASQKSGTNCSRRSRVAEVHNLSERRRRDRINEKMRALQELIPHANKSDKASMLDEAIEYMKYLQLQIQIPFQLMCMGRGMVPMMLPGMQHYMSHVGMGIGPTMLPAIQNLMRLSRLPLVDQAMNMHQARNQAQVGHNPMLNPVNYPNSSFQEQYANYMSFHSMQNASPQAMNMFEFGLHSGKQNRASAPYSNGNKLTG